MKHIAWQDDNINLKEGAQRPLEMDKKGEFQQMDVMKQLLKAGFVTIMPTTSSGDRHQSEMAGRKSSTQVITLNKDNQRGSRQEIIKGREQLQ